MFEKSLSPTPENPTPAVPPSSTTEPVPAESAVSREPVKNSQYVSRYRHPSGLVDRAKVGAFNQELWVVSPEEIEEGKVAYPRDLIRHADHPIVAEAIAADPAVAARLELGSLSWFNHFTAHLEHDFVNDVLLDIAYDKGGIGLPNPFRRDAFVIYLEEANHAFLADDLTDQWVKILGVRRRELPRPAFYERLRRLEARVAPEHRGLVRLMFVVGTETSITGVLSKLPKYESVVTAVRMVIKDHYVDEGRHRAYFTDVFQALWPGLPESAKRAVGPLLPEIVKAFLSPDPRAIHAQLVDLGLSPADAANVIRETYSKDKVNALIIDSAAGTLSLFRRNGVFNDSRVGDAFETAGLLIGSAK